MQGTNPTKRTEIEMIGKRVSVFKSDDVHSYVIQPTDVKWKLHLLFAWFFLWTVSGVIVMVNYFSVPNANIKIIVIVWLAFWAYFEFKIGKAFLFRKFGKEKIWIKKGMFNYWRDVAGKGKKLSFEAGLVKNIQPAEKNKKDFFQFMNESFWVIGGESISFEYGAKIYRMAIQLEEEDARELVRQLKHALRN